MIINGLNVSGRVIAGPAAPAVDPYFSNVSILLHGEGANNSTTVTDSSSNNFSNTVNANAKISTAQFRYGAASISLSGGTTGDNSDRITYGTSSAALALLASSTFTLEASVYLTGNSIRTSTSSVLGGRSACIVNSNFITSTPASAYWWIISGDATNTGTGMQYATWDSGNTQRRIAWDFPSTLNKNQWYDLAICRSGGSWYAFLDGVLLGSPTANTITNTTQTQATGNLRVGSTPWYNSSGANNFSAGLVGYIDELRITKGIARYTANYTPTGPFPNTGP